MPAIFRLCIMLAAIGAMLFVLFFWLDVRVDRLLAGTRAGDMLQVQSDECWLLQRRGLIDTEIHCGRGRRLEVQRLE